MAQERVRFAELLTQHITNTLQKKFSNEALSTPAMHSMRASIRQIIDNVFLRSKHQLSETARAWLTDQYFKRFQVNSTQLMADLVVLNEYKLSQLTYDDVRLLHDLFDQTDLAEELDKEYRTRSAS